MTRGWVNDEPIFILNAYSNNAMQWKSICTSYFRCQRFAQHDLDNHRIKAWMSVHNRFFSQILSILCILYTSLQRYTVSILFKCLFIVQQCETVKLVGEVRSQIQTVFKKSTCFCCFEVYFICRLHWCRTSEHNQGHWFDSQRKHIDKTVQLERTG